MSEKNSVTVLVFGQEYNLAGDMPRDYVMKIADHVDAKMKQISEGNSNQPMSAVAVLAAMLIADEYYSSEDYATSLLEQNQKLDENGQKYEKLWEEVKQNFSNYKVEMDQLTTTNEALQRYASEKEQKLNALTEELDKAAAANAELTAKIEELSARVSQSEDAPVEAQKKIEELENRCRDIESSFFDIQMENIRLKNEIETYRSNRF